MIIMVSHLVAVLNIYRKGFISHKSKRTNILNLGAYRPTGKILQLNQNMAIKLKYGLMYSYVAYKVPILIRLLMEVTLVYLAIDSSTSTLSGLWECTTDDTELIQATL